MIRKMLFFYWFKRLKIYVILIILKDSGIMCNMKILLVILIGFIINYCFN